MLRSRALALARLATLRTKGKGLDMEGTQQLLSLSPAADADMEAVAEVLKMLAKRQAKAKASSA